MTDTEPPAGSLTVYNFVKASQACEIYLMIQYRGSGDTDGYALSSNKHLHPPWDHVCFMHGRDVVHLGYAGTTNVIVWEHDE